MCDNTAVRWSEYELSRKQQESEIRLKISKELEKHLEECGGIDFSNEYLMGVEHARLLILLDSSTKTPTPSLDVQEKLF